MGRNSKRARTETRVTSIYDLPDEVVIQFFVDLDLPDLCRAAQVNWQWNNLVKHVMPSAFNYDLLKELQPRGDPLESVCHSSKHAEHTIFFSESPFTDKELAMTNAEREPFRPKIATGFKIYITDGVYNPYIMMHDNKESVYPKGSQKNQKPSTYQILKHIADGPASSGSRLMYVASWFAGIIEPFDLMQSPDETFDMCVAAMRYARDSLYGDVLVGMQVYNKKQFYTHSTFFIAYRPDDVKVTWRDLQIHCNTSLVRSAALYEALTKGAQQIQTWYSDRRFILPNDDVLDSKVVEMLRVWVSEMIECANAQNWRVTCSMSTGRLSTMKTVRCRPFQS